MSRIPSRGRVEKAAANACRTLFFAFAKAGCALVQMTPIRADLENIFIELTEDEPVRKEGADQ